MGAGDRISREDQTHIKSQVLTIMYVFSLLLFVWFGF